MLSVLVHTLGCKLNQLESEAFTDAFRQAGFTLIDSSNEISPSVIVINTCTVTSKADQKARRVIRKALRDYPSSLVLVTGCYAQLNKLEIDELDDEKSGRLFVLKGMEKDKILDLPRLLSKKAGMENTLNGWYENPVSDAEGVFQFSPESFSSHTRSFLKIQDGCDNHCTYCRIRLARGRSVSLESGQVLERLRFLEKHHAEAVLTGVNISQYSDEKNENLAALLEYLLSNTEKISLRLSSLAPDIIDENFTKILTHKRIRPHFHLSIQSGSEKVLEKMGRGYNVEIVKKAANFLRRAKDDPFLVCDIIAGFPGETEAEFDKTFNLCKETGFAWIHVFPYSKREGTSAFSFTETVPEREVSKRVNILTDLAWQGRREYVQRWLDREVDVLIEKSVKSACRGVSENYLKLLVQHNGEKKPLPGAVLRCRLNKEQNTVTGDYDAVAYSI